MSDLERIPDLPESGGGADGEQALRMLRLVWRGKWYFLILPLLGAGIAFAYFGNRIPGLNVVPRYRATANLLVQLKEVDPVTGQAELTASPRTKLNQQTRLFSSDSIQGPLSRMPEIQQLPSIRAYGGKSVRAVLKDFLKARVDEGQDRLTVFFEAARKEDAETVVNLAMQAFREYHATALRKKIQEQTRVINEARDATNQRLGEVQVQIRDLRREYGITGEKATNPFADDVSDLKQTVLQTRRDILAAEVRLAEAEANQEDAELWRAFGERLRLKQTSSVLEDEIQGYLQDKHEKESKLPDLIARFSEEYDQVQELKQAIEVLDGLIERVYERYAQKELEDARGQLAQEQSVLERLEVALAEVEQEYYEMEEGLSELLFLEEERAQLREERATFAEAINKLAYSQETGGLYTEVIDPARATKKPVYPEIPKMMGFGAGIGFFLAAIIVSLRGMTDRRIWSPEEVPGMLGLSVVGVLPAMSSRKPQKVGRIVETEPGSLAAEAVRSVRTSATFALGEDGSGVVLLTSSVSGEGKSISSSNLAIAFAQSGRKTLLVDADLRKPGQNAIFNLIGKRGLGDAIEGEVTWENAIVQKVSGDLDLLPAGGADRGPAELLESSACRALFAELRREYDVIVVDSSPVLETAETRVLSTIADVCLFVMRIDHSTGPDAKRALGILRSVDANVAGVFLNGATKRRGAKAYAEGISYGYGYAYGGGYGRADRKEKAPPADLKKRPSEGSVEAWS